MVSIRDLSKFYGNVKALDKISFELHPGDICGYVGTNGAGKTTTVKILSCIENYNEGSVSIFDFDPYEDEIKIKRLTGYVPETADLFGSLKVGEFLEFTGEMRDIEKNVYEKRYFYFAKLFGFENSLDTPIAQLSKGNKQKVLITSTLMHNPDLILLDEPLNGLDSNSIIIFQDMIKEFSLKGKIILYCSHLLESLEKISNRIIFLDKGKIIIDKKLDDLKKDESYSDLTKLFTELEPENQRKKFSYEEVYS